MKMHGPFKIDIKVAITDGDRTAEVSYCLPTGKQIADYDEVLLNALKEAQSQLGESWRLCTKQEYFNMLVADKTGSSEKFAMTGSRDWDKP